MKYIINYCDLLYYLTLHLLIPCVTGQCDTTTCYNMQYSIILYYITYQTMLICNTFSYDTILHYIIKHYSMLCYVLLYSAMLYYAIAHYIVYDAMLCHAIPYTLLFCLGLAPGPKPQSPKLGRELIFGLGAGTWPKASEPLARAN